VDDTSGDPNVTFPGSDPVITTDGSAGPWISSARSWHLKATASTHLCLAVEISSTGDPYIPPTLEGNTPGWGTGTDLRVVSDNNKAQRNMHLTTVPANSSANVTDWAIVHNSALAKRDVPLKIQIDGVSQRHLSNVRVVSVGVEQPLNLRAKDGSSFVLQGLEPGENRWVALTLQTQGLQDGMSAFVGVDELTGNSVASGFAVGVRSASLRAVMRDNLMAQRAVLVRVESWFEEDHGDSMDKYVESAALSPESFDDFVHKEFLPRLEQRLDKIGLPTASDPFNLKSSFAEVASEKSLPMLLNALSSLLNGVDAQLTRLQLQKGDVADIEQMVRWQKRLYQQQPELKKLTCAEDVVGASTWFLRGRSTRALTNAAYPELLDKVTSCLRAGVKMKGGAFPVTPFEHTSLFALEKEHRNYLLVLAH